MSCPQTQPAPLRCPTFEESLAATAALMPRGAAWPVNEGGGLIARYLTWLAGFAGSVPPRDAWGAGYVMAGFIAAVAAVINYVETRLCDLREEFFCATAKETRPEWLKEYGLPDACDPFPDLCAKVAALGGQTCAYFVDTAARAGWTVACEEPHGICGDEPGADPAGWTVAYCGAEAGSAVTGDDYAGAGRFGSIAVDICGAQTGDAETGGGGVSASQRIFYCGAEAGAAEAGCDFSGASFHKRTIPELLFRVDIANSPTYQGRWETQPMAGALDAGSQLACAPDISPLKCLIDRIAPAHAHVSYEIIPPAVFLMADANTFLTDETGNLLYAE